MMMPIQTHPGRVRRTVFRTISTSAFVMSALCATAQQPVINESRQEDTVAFPGSANEVVFSLPKRGLQADELLVVYNVNQQASIDIKDCYVTQRNIPAQNVLGVSSPTNAEISSADAQDIRDSVDAALVGRDDIQAIAFAWKTPWRVSVPGNVFNPLQSVTTYVSRFPFAENLYFDSPSSRPWTDYGIRPAMLITPEASENCGATGLIARGVQSDGSMPAGNGFLLRTSDVSRSVRYEDFIDTVDAFVNTPLNLEYQDLQSGPNDLPINNANITSFEQLEMTGDFLSNESDVMFHFTGLATVPGIATNTFVPGAFADHMTSGAGAITFRGGDFFDCSPEPCTPPNYASTQMSALNWLENGATGSYGNVAEPFANTRRFPDSLELISNYFYGGTMLESIGKSVVDPVLGLAIGEPLARPYGTRIDTSGGAPAVDTTALKPGQVYSVWSAPELDGTFERTRSNIVVTEPGINAIQALQNSRHVVVEEETDPFYLSESVRRDFFLCSFKTASGIAWCDNDGNLWHRADNEEPELISDNVFGNTATANGDKLYWLKRATSGTTTDLYTLDLAGGAVTFLTATTSDSPINLVASDDLVAWSNTVFLNFPQLVAYDIATNQVATQLDAATTLWLTNQVAVHDSTIAFVGWDNAASQAGIFSVEFGQSAEQISSAPQSATDLRMDANWLVWREDGEIHVNDYANSTATKVLSNRWSLDGPARSLDLRDGAVVVIQESSAGNRMWLEHLQSGESLLLPATPSNKLRDFASIARLGTAYTNFESTYYSITSDGFTETQDTYFHVILSYEATAANALLDAIDDLTASHGESVQFYLRPANEFLRRGQFSYEVALGDGGDAAGSGISLDVRPMGDVNGDGTTNFIDYSILTNAIFSSVGDANFVAAADFDNSGSINFLDAFILIDHFLDPDSANAALVTWDTSAVAQGESVDVVLTMVANQGARIKKTVRLTAQ